MGHGVADPRAPAYIVCVMKHSLAILITTLLVSCSSTLSDATKIVDSAATVLELVDRYAGPQLEPAARRYVPEAAGAVAQGRDAAQKLLSAYSAWQKVQAEYQKLEDAKRTLQSLEQDGDWRQQLPCFVNALEQCAALFNAAGINGADKLATLAQLALPLNARENFPTCQAPPETGSGPGATAPAALKPPPLPAPDAGR